MTYYIVTRSVLVFTSFAEPTPFPFPEHLCKLLHANSTLVDDCFVTFSNKEGYKSKDGKEGSISNHAVAERSRSSRGGSLPPDPDQSRP
jgi:hypothetical protein